MTKKRIIIHGGAHKTGTSALQAFFSANADVLKQSGVDYPYPEPDSHVAAGVCSGNLVQVMFKDGFMSRHRKALKVRDDLDDAARQRLSQRVAYVPDEPYFKRLREIVDASDCDTVLFSGELFIAMELAQMKLFKEIVADEHDAQIVIFVRDLFDFLYSAWRQVVKRAGYGKPFADYHRNIVGRAQGIPMIHGLRRLKEVGLATTVVNYDSFSKDIAGAFLAAGGIDLVGDAAYELGDVRHNRSLTPAEAVLVQQVNAAYRGTGFPQTFTRLLLKKASAGGKRSTYYSREIHQELLDEYARDLRDINESIVGDPLSLELRDSPTVEPNIDPADITVLLEAFGKAATFKTKRMKANNVIAKSWLLLKHRFVPWDFNPEAYLLLNEDVAQSKQDPYVHYALFGRFEGRQYKYS